jgi:hypothetical protein
MAARALTVNDGRDLLVESDGGGGGERKALASVTAAKAQKQLLQET